MLKQIRWWKKGSVNPIKILWIIVNIRHQMFIAEWNRKICRSFLFEHFWTMSIEHIGILNIFNSRVEETELKCSYTWGEYRQHSYSSTNSDITFEYQLLFAWYANSKHHVLRFFLHVQQSFLQFLSLNFLGKGSIIIINSRL